VGSFLLLALFGGILFLQLLVAAAPAAAPASISCGRARGVQRTEEMLPDAIDCSPAPCAPPQHPQRPETIANETSDPVKMEFEAYEELGRVAGGARAAPGQPLID
jgi:hypothetical protein